MKPHKEGVVSSSPAVAWKEVKSCGDITPKIVSGTEGKNY